MTTKIPDDVVEKLWRDLCEKSDRTSPAEYPDMAFITLDELRAAGRVFVEWEREQCAKVCADYAQLSDEVGSEYHESDCARALAAGIRARSAPEKDNAHE